MPDNDRNDSNSGQKPSHPNRPHHRKKPKRPGSPGKSQGTRQSGPKALSPARTGIRLRALGDNAYELDHPPCVRETELDYEEGIEIWKAGDPEDARDALRFALSACRDNLWVHVALGQIALREFNDAQLSIGHFGYAVELTSLVLTARFSGILLPERPNNRPVYDAIDGLIECYEKQGKARDAARYRALRDSWSGKGRASEGPRGTKV
jgi:hypothetical protein